MMDGWKEGEMDGGKEGEMDGGSLREGGMNGWKDGLVYVSMFEASLFGAS